MALSRWAERVIDRERQERESMPINPKYAAVIEKNKAKSGGGDREKLPAIWLNNVGDGFRGTVTRVSDIIELEKTYNGETKKFDAQFIDLKDVVIRRLDAQAGEFTEESLPEGTFMLSKGGHFEAVYAALMELNASVEGEGFDDIPVGGTLAFRRLANDDKRHMFSAKVTSGIPF